MNAAFSTLPGPARPGFRPRDRRSRGVRPRRRRAPARATSAAARRDSPRRPTRSFGKYRGAPPHASAAASWQIFCSASTAIGRPQPWSAVASPAAIRRGSASQAAASMPRSARSSASCGWPPLAASRTAGCATPRRASQASASAAGGTGSATCWQRLRIVGSRLSGAAEQSRKRASPAGSSSVFRNAFAATSFIRSAGWTTTTLPRPRADVVVAKAIAARTASTRISLLGLRLPPSPASSPSLPPRSQPSDSRSASGTSTQQIRMRARRVQLAARAAPARPIDERPVVGLAQPGLRELAARARTGRRRPGRGSGARGRCCVSRVRRSGVASHGRPRSSPALPRSERPVPTRAHARRASSAPAPRRSALAPRLVARRCRCERCAPAPRASAPGSRREPVRRRRGPRASNRSAARAAARRDAASAGSTSNQSVRSGCRPRLHPALSSARSMRPSWPRPAPW